MKKEDFIKLGLDEEQATKCAETIAKELENTVPYTRFKEKVDEANELKNQVKERDVQLETLKNSKSKDEELKAEIAKLQQENKDKEDSYNAEMHKLKVNQVVENALKTKGAINLKAVLPFLEDLDKAEFLEDGSVKGLSDQIDKLLTSDDTKFLFGSEKPGIKGAKPFESGNDDGEKPIDLSNLDYEALCSALENE